MARRRRRRSGVLTRWVYRLPEPWQGRLSYITASGAFRRRMGYGIGGLLALAVLWIGITGLIARSEVSKLQTQLHEVRVLVSQGRVAEAQRAATGIPGLAKRAHLLTTGPAWWGAAEIPYFGEPLQVIRAATTAGKEVGVDGIQTLLNVATSLDPANLREHGNTIKVAPLEQAAEPLARAAHALDDATATVDRLSARTWFSPVNRLKLEFGSQLHQIVGYIDAAANAARVMPDMLGSSTPKTYFIGLQNEAEMRGTGGIPGAFAIAKASKGTISFTEFFSDAIFLPAATKQHIDTGLEFGKDYDSTYGYAGPTSIIQNTNMSPNFPYAAQIWAAMWQKVSGQKVDGAIALDPTTLAYILAAIGPVDLPSGQEINSNNVVSLTERDEYAMFNDNFKRKDYLVSILQTVSKRLISGAGSPTLIAQAMTLVSQQQRILVWSKDPAAEAVLARTDYGGVLPSNATPLSAFVVNNIPGGKLDFYLGRSIDYRRTGCGSNRDVFVTLTLTNNAPASGLPSYVVNRGDKATGPAGVQPGDDRTLVDYYATSGAQLLSATINGRPTTVAVRKDLNHPIFREDVELPRGTATVLTLHLQEPAGSGTPMLWRQPGVTPLGVQSFSQAC